MVFQMTGWKAVPVRKMSWFWGIVYREPNQTGQSSSTLQDPDEQTLVQKNTNRWHISLHVRFALIGDPSQVEVSSCTNTSRWLPPLRASKSDKWWLNRSHCKFGPVSLMDGQGLGVVWAGPGRFNERLVSSLELVCLKIIPTGSHSGVFCFFFPRRSNHIFYDTSYIFPDSVFLIRCSLM